MNLDIRTPCKECPFRRSGDGAVRLMRARIVEIVEMVAPADYGGGHFPCHKTTGVAGNRVPKQQSHCAGAILFANKQGVSTNYVRIAARLSGGLTEDDFHGGDDVFDDLDEMLASALDARPLKRRNPPRRTRAQRQK